MSILKGDKLNICLILVLLLSVGASIYSLWSYKGSPLAADGGFAQRTQAFQPGGRFGQNGDGFAQHGGGSVSGRDSQPRPRNSGSSASGGSIAPPGGNSSANRGGGMHPAGGDRSGGAAGASSQYALPLAIYAASFFCLAVAAYYWVMRKKVQFQAGSRPLLIWTLLGAGLFLRIAAAPWIAGHPFDINLFKSWAASAADNLTGFYLKGSSDYPPFYIYILYAAGKLAKVGAMSSYSTLLIKLPSILADAGTSFFLFRAARKHVSFETSFLIAAFYMFNPAVFINSTFWGQVDSFFTLIVMVAVYLLSENKPGWSAALLTAAVLTKPQGIVYVPVLFFALVSTKRAKAWLAAAGSALVTALLVVMPFSFGQSPLWLFKLYSGTVNEYPYASVNAYNFFALLGANYRKDSSMLLFFNYHTWGMIFIVIVTLFSWLMYRRSANAAFASVAALLQIAGVFTFSSSMHERYLFPAVALALLVYVFLQDNRLLWLAAGFCLTVFLNTYDIFYHSTSGGASYSFTLFITSLLNVILCGYLAKVVWDCGSRKKFPHNEGHCAVTGIS